MRDYFDYDEMYLPGNDEMSDSLMRNWTTQAIECYSINCDCKNCSLSSGHYSFVCQMPKVVENLIKTVGTPGTQLLGN